MLHFETKKRDHGTLQVDSAISRVIPQTLILTFDYKINPAATAAAAALLAAIKPTT